MLTFLLHPSKKKQKKTKNEIGEYIDYEEID